MKTLENNSDSIGEALKVLEAGGTIAHPADTCYGLAADLMNELALKKLQAIKGRDANKPMSIMLPVYLKAKLEQYVVLDDFSEMVSEKLLPGPVTIVLGKGPQIPDYFFPEIKTVGIRIPYDRMTNDLLTKFQGPLITTSANRSNEPVCCNAREVIKVFQDSNDRPDLLLAGEINGACVPSTVIQVEGEAIKILREGPLKKEQIEAILGISI